MSPLFELLNTVFAPKVTPPLNVWEPATLIEPPLRTDGPFKVKPAALLLSAWLTVMCAASTVIGPAIDTI